MVSSASADLISIPFSAPLPVPTIIATGVASPREHGQDITSTAMAQFRANEKSYPSANHTINVIREMPITTGTNTPATLSAILAIGAFDDEASSTKAMILEMAVSSPTSVAFILTLPFLFIVAAISLSPFSFCTGILSPVMALSSTLVLPSIIIPSTGMLSPGRTITISPTTTSSVSMFSSTPSRSTFALFGDKSISFDIASVVLAFEPVSKNFPKVIRVKIMDTDSK